MSDQIRLGCILPAVESPTATPLPLQHTGVAAQIAGAIAHVTVRQTFGNPLKEAISLRYLFPLPHTAAIVDYVVTIGPRTIKAQLQEKDAARRTYEQATQAGQRASLLEQQRPNLFTIELSNVQPGETILTEVVYEERLKYEDGAYEFVFPMGITPRYHSPNTVHTSAPANVDAPFTADHTQVGPVEITVALDAGVPVADPASRTHGITLTRQDERHVSLTLANREIPNKDFVLRYVVSGEKMQSAAWSSKSDEGDTALLMLIPPRLDLNEAPAPREFVFVIDRSGSMSGGPLQQAVNALKACLRALNDTDTFLIQAFDDQIEWLDAKPRPVTQANVLAADTWLDTVNARGGTEMMPAIAAALTLPADAERQRYVVFLTDGAVSADTQAIAQIAKQRGQARIFSFGIGPSVNRYLLNKMAEMGRGVAEFLGAEDDIEGALTRFQDRVSYPALLDLAITWHNATAWDTYPAALPDLYIGQPLEISTQLKRTGSDAAAIATGQARGQQVTFQAPLPAATDSNPTIERLHARARIEALVDESTKGGDAEKIRRQIISLAIEHRLMTPYTSFVAVDSETTQSTGGKEVDVAVPLPDGLKMEGFLGGDQSQTLVGSSQVMRSSVRRQSASPAKGTFASFAPPPTPKPAAPLSPSQASKSASRQNRSRDMSEGAALPRKPSPAASAPQEPEPDKEKGGLAGFVDKILGKKKAESRLTEHFLNEVLPRREAKPSGPLESIEPPNIELGLRNLTRNQNVNGSWGDSIELTAAALLAFVRSGHTTRAGQYRRQVQKAMAWLLSQLPSAHGYDVFVAVRALDELYAAAGDGQIAPEVRQALPKAQTYLERVTAGEALPVPEGIMTLDTVRMTALAQGRLQVPFELLQTPDAEKVMVWSLLDAPKA